MAAPAELVAAVTTDDKNLHADLTAVEDAQAVLSSAQSKQAADTTQQTTDQTNLGTALNGPPLQVFLVGPDNSGNSVAYVPTGGTSYAVLQASIIPVAPVATAKQKT